MKLFLRNLIPVFVLLLCVGLITACSNDDDNSEGNDNEAESSFTISDELSEEYDIPEDGESEIFNNIIDNGFIRAGVAVAPPWLLQNPENNEYFGPSVDIVEKIAEIFDVEVEFVDTTWDAVVAGLQADKFDIIIAPLSATEERMKVIDFVNYTEAGTAYFVKKDNPLADKLNNYEDLNNPDVTIVTYTGTGNEQEIIRKYPDAGNRSIPQPPGGQPPIEDILAGRGDVGHMDSPLALKIEKNYPDLKVIGGAENSVNNPDAAVPVGMGIQKEDEAFKDFLQSVVDSMEEEIKAEIMKYSLED